MALKAILTKDEHGALGDALKAEYKEQDGKFVLQVTPVSGWALEDVQGLKGALQKERSDHEASKKKIEAFGEIDPAKAKDALDQVEKMKTWTPEEKVKAQIEAVKKDLETKHTKEFGDLTKERDGLLSEVHKHLVTASATSALQKHKGSVELLLPHVERCVKCERGPDGKFVAKVIDPATGAERVTMQQGKTHGMDIDEFVSSMKEDKRFNLAFEGSGANGAGSRAGEGGAGGKLPDGATPEERLTAAFSKTA